MAGIMLIYALFAGLVMIIVAFVFIAAGISTLMRKLRRAKATDGADQRTHPDAKPADVIADLQGGTFRR